MPSAVRSPSSRISNRPSRVKKSSLSMERAPEVVLGLAGGYPDDYPQALLLQRAIGLACLAAAAAAWWRDARLGHAGLGRRPDL